MKPVIRIAGTAIALIATVVTALLEIELSVLRLGGVTGLFRGEDVWSGGGPLIGLAAVLAIGANLAIAWFAVRVAGRNWAIGPPWALWTVIMLAAAGVRTNEGDYLISGTNWVALVMILTGSLAFAVPAYRMILQPPPTISGLTADSE
ncbi:hypothetical protein [Actinoplanes sp. NPDC051851]|uniref:hypothetical protein n=1 Tax=Actinoplanes sp. NPDC051851 TaxID=3154753 RepID=UPI0034204C2C